MSIRNHKIHVIIIIIFFLISCTDQPESLEGEKLLVLEDASLIDGTGASIHEGATIIIEGDKIIRVGKKDDYLFPKDATILNLKNRFVIPGFVNVHFHVTPESWKEVMSTLLAFGITTIRNPGAVTGGKFELEVRSKLSSGEVIGPRMLTAGCLINGPSFLDNRDGFCPQISEKEIRQEVRNQIQQGFDFIKVYAHLPLNLLAIVIEEAHSQGIQVIGHLGKTSWTDAAQNDIDVISHSALGGPTWELVPIDQREVFKNNYFPPVTGLENYNASKFRFWRDLVKLDGPEMNKLISTLLDKRVFIDPNFVVFEAIIWSDDLNVRERLEPDYAPESMRNRWRKNVYPNTTNWTETDFKEAKATWPIFMEIIRIFYERGVPLAAGTDFGTPWITPGVAFHRELELLVAAGIPMLDVLSIATKNGAEMIGLKDELGTIEKGKMADLIILTKDPFKDIRNTRSIETVIKNGKILQPDTLLAYK